MVAHYLNIYQKPKAGNSFLRRYLAYNYKHKISAVGWYDTASCDIVLPGEADVQQFLDQFLGNRVAVFVDNPVEPAWEGFINRILYNAGAYLYTVSLDEMFNRTSTVFNSSGAPASSPAANNTDSQAIYAIKAGKFEMGAQGSVGLTTALRDTLLKMRAWPQSSIAPSGGGGSVPVTIEMLGFYHTLSWELYNDATNGAVAVSTLLTNYLLPAVANGQTFFDNTDTSLIATNSVTGLQTRTRGQPIWDIMRELQEGGDGTNYYVIGITPTNFHTGKRRLYYQIANTGVEYTARRSDGLRVRNVYGQLVPPWHVRPDRGIRVTDMLPAGWNDRTGDDPRETYIASVSYESAQQTVIWSGADDIRAEGAFQLKNYNLPHGKRFGATRRFA